MTAYYNEHDPFAAAWLRELIKTGHIAPGKVDERSIEDVKPADLAGFNQCHFFAGVGGWSLALRLARWKFDGRVTWTGSCPCQPFSAAGKGGGASDERHLWPAFHHLIAQCRPDVIFGEQVEAAINHGWLDLVQNDLEGEGYAFGAVGLPAACVGAPHIRQRLWFVADRSANGRREERADVRGRDARDGAQGWAAGFKSSGGTSELVDAKPTRLQEQRGYGGISCETRDASSGQAAVGASTPTRGFWYHADWLPCRDGKARPTQPGLFPLAHGVPERMVRGSNSSVAFEANSTAEARVGRLKGYGNAIVPQAAAEIIMAYRGPHDNSLA